jgi:transcription initiation factor TFIIIB Brf1 subunit/transcription initiation factor TFIIB
MSSSDCIEHSEVLDQHTGTIVCVVCCRVIKDGLTHFEVNQQKYSTFQENLKDEKKINGENVYELLEKISDKLHLSQSSVDIAYIEYKKITKKIQKILSYPNKKPHPTSILSPEIVLMLSIYTALKKDFCPRSIDFLCNIAGLQESANVFKLAAFLEKNKDDDTNSTRLQPLKAKDLLLTHYTCIDNFSFEDVNRMNDIIEALKKNTFTPHTTAAGAVYLYARNVKCTKQTMRQVSSLFNVTTTSIQRFINKYKLCFS